MVSVHNKAFFCSSFGQAAYPLATSKLLVVVVVVAFFLLSLLFPSLFRFPSLFPSLPVPVPVPVPETHKFYFPFIGNGTSSPLLGFGATGVAVSPFKLVFPQTASTFACRVCRPSLATVRTPLAQAPPPRRQYKNENETC